MPRTNEYFLPGEGIDREVISADIARHLGNDALVRPGNHQFRGRVVSGYYITAYRNLTPAMIADLQSDSARWSLAKQRYGSRTGYQSRLARGISPSREPRYTPEEESAVYPYGHQLGDLQQYGVIDGNLYNAHVPMWQTPSYQPPFPGYYTVSPGDGPASYTQLGPGPANTYTSSPGTQRPRKQAAASPETNTYEPSSSSSTASPSYSSSPYASSRNAGGSSSYQKVDTYYQPNSQ